MSREGGERVQELHEIQEFPVRRFPAREAMQRARLHLSGQTVTMVLALLFCLTALYAWYLLSVLLAGALVALLRDALLVFTLYFAVLSLAVVLLLLPLWAGRIRMAGLVAAKRPCELGELFYYFRSPHLWLRGIAVSLLLVLSLLFPPCFGAAALYAGKETLSFGGAMRESFRTRKKLRDVLGFWAHVLRHLVFSVLTLGVLWILYYAHHSAVAYFEMMMTMDPKGDLQ